MQERKKILWMSHFLPYPPKGGAQMRSFNLIKQLAQYHDVYLYSIVDPSKLTSYFSDPAIGVEQAKAEFSGYCREVKFCVQEKIGRLAKLFALGKSLLLGRSYSECLINNRDILGFINTISVDDFDCVHLDTISLTSFVRFFKNKKIHLNHHNIESDMMFRRHEKEKNPFKKLIFKQDAIKIRRMELGSAQYIFQHFVCSELDKLRLNRILPLASVTVIENGINPSKSIISRDLYRKNSALFIGGLDWYPNADAVNFILMEIFPILKEKNIDITLDIVGKNPSSEIKEMSRSFSGVRIHGFVDDIADFYARSSFFICPIRDGGGTKLKILEAMANGIPILAHPIAFEGIDAVDGVHYFAAESPEEFCEKIEELLVIDDLTLQEISNNALNLVKNKYDYSEIGKKLSLAYL